MTEFQIFHPDNEAKGSAIMAALAALDDQQVKTVMQANGINAIDADTWYPQQLELDILKSINTDFLNMVAVGMKIPEVAMFPPQIDSVHGALEVLDMAYRMNVRGPDIGEYVYERTGDRSATITCRNSYPSDLDYGIIYALVRRFRSADSKDLSVKRDDTIPNRTTGGDTCVYYVKW